MMESKENEVVELFRVINVAKARGQVEKWLLELEDVMKLTVKNVIVKSIDGYNKTKNRLEWICESISQAVLFVTQLFWTLNVEEALKNTQSCFKNLTNYLATYNEQISEIVNFIRNYNTLTKDAGKMKNIHSTIGALIVLEIHSRDVLQELVDKKLSSVDDFIWMSQLRYYALENDEYVCRMVTAERVYGYEYLGNTSRLVITPLTDRCYR